MQLYSSRKIGSRLLQAARLFSSSPPSDEYGLNLEKKPRNLKVVSADLSTNARPSKFNLEEIMTSIDPKTMLKKEPSYEYRELPKDGIDKNEYHPMQALEEFPNTDNDISKEYGFKIKGLEPTRFNDWERKGRCSDF